MLPIWNGEDFGGAKLGLVLDGQVLTYLRDDRPDIPFPNCWDLPGGGREGSESPVECALRELAEEFGLDLPTDRLIHGRRYKGNDGTIAYFFTGAFTQDDLPNIRFGDEGQYWRMMPVDEYLGHSQAVPALQRRLSDCLSGSGG